MLDPGVREARAGQEAHLLQVVLEVKEGQVSLHLADHFHSQYLLFMDDGQVQEPEGRGKNPRVSTMRGAREARAAGDCARPGFLEAEAAVFSARLL